MNQNREYYAFISYKSEDKEWAIWLQHELEHYHLPVTLNGRTDLPKELRPVFRDIDELSAGNLPGQIRAALANSANLIVVCSPLSAQSPWVNQEVETFIAMGKTDRIFPFIVEGHPFAKNPADECFPLAIRNLPKEEERLGGDVTKNGRDAAFVKVVAGMLGLGFDTLWNRYEHEKAEEERKIREQRDNLLRVQSLFLAEKANALVEEGDSYTAKLLALEALPKDLENPDRPYVAEAETALRAASAHSSAIFTDPAIGSPAIFSPDGSLFAFPLNNTIGIYDTATGVRQHLLAGHSETINDICFRHDGAQLASASDDGSVRFWDVASGEEKHRINCLPCRVCSVSFNADGGQVVTGSSDGTVRLWSVTTGEEIRRFDCPDEKNAEESWTAAHFSPDGQYIAIKYNNPCRYTPIYVWHYEPTQSRWTILTSTGDNFVENIAFTLDSKYMAYKTNDDEIMIWNLEKNCEQKRLQTDKDPVSFDPMAFSHDTSKLAYSTLDNNIVIIDSRNGLPLKHLTGIGAWVTSLMFSPDNNLLLSASSNSTVRLWELKASIDNIIQWSDGISSAALHPHQKIIAARKGHSLTIRNYAPRKRPLVEKIATIPATGDANPLNIQFGDDRKHLLISQTEDQKVILFDTTNFDKKNIFDANIATLMGDGKSLAANDNRNKLTIFDIHTGKAVKKIITDDTYIRTLQSSHDGKYLIIAHENSVNIWDVDNNLSLWKIDRCIGATISDSGNTLAVSELRNEDNCVPTLVFYDFHTRRELRTLHGFGAERMTFSHDGHYLLMSDAYNFRPQLLDVNQGRIVVSDTDAIAFWDTDRKHILFSNRMKAELYILDTENRNRRYTQLDTISSPAILAPDRKHIIFCNDNALWRIKIDSLNFDNIIQVGDGYFNETLSFSPDGTLLAVSSANEIRVIDTHTLTTLWRRHFDNEPVNTLSFSYDGKSLIYSFNSTNDNGETDGNVIICNAHDGTATRHITSLYSLTKASLSPNGKNLAATNGNQCLIFDTGTAQAIHTLAHDRALKDLAYSPDGSIIAVACHDQMIHLWDAATGKKIKTLIGHKGCVNTVLFTTDGKQLLSASADTTACVWDIESGTILYQFTRHKSEITSLSLHAQGNIVLSTDKSGTIYLWHFCPSADLIRSMQTKYKTQTLTPQQKNIYHLD